MSKRWNVCRRVLRPRFWNLPFLGVVLACAAAAVTPPASQGAGQTPAGPVTTVLSESFESWPPPGWALVADPQTGGVWGSSSHPGGCIAGSSYPYANATGGSGLFADANSDCYGDAMDAAMVTPSFSLASPSYVSAQLQFKSDFFCLSGLDDAWVDVTTDDGAIWTNLLYFDHQSARGPSTQTVDLTPYLGQPNVRLSFEYESAGWDWYWQVDDVAVTAEQQGTCTLACTATVPETASPGVPAAFSATATPTDCGSAPSYAWTFGDGQTSTLQNPAHAYDNAGTYDWSLTVAADGATCTKSGTITVSSICGLACAATVPASASAGVAASFAAAATPSAGCSGSPSFAWAFGDGQGSSDQNPTHAYSSAGTYAWSLTATVDGVSCSRGGSVIVAPAGSAASGDRD